MATQRLFVNQASKTSNPMVQPSKTEGIYAVHPGVKADGRIAVFGEMISIVGEQKKILGRS